MTKRIIVYVDQRVSVTRMMTLVRQRGADGPYLCSAVPGVYRQPRDGLRKMVITVTVVIV